MPPLTINCIQCGTPKSVRQIDLDRGDGRFCSKTCFADWHRGRKRVSHAPNKICALCAAPFYRHPSKAKSSSGLYYCCRDHKDQAQRLDSTISGVLRPSHYGSGNGSSDYRERALAHFNNVCDCCGFSDVPEVLVVHHRDRDRTNNTLDNLRILCPTCHDVDHFRAGDGRFRDRTAAA